MDLSGGNRSLPLRRIKKHDCTPFRSSAHGGKDRVYRSFSGVEFRGSKALFSPHDENSALQSRYRRNTRMSCVNVPYRWQTQAGGMQRSKEGKAKAEWSELPHPPSPSKRSPAKRIRFEKEEGGSGYAAFTALTETGKAEWSELLLTRKGCGQSGIGTVPPSPHREKPGNSKYRRKTTCRSPTPLPIC